MKKLAYLFAALALTLCACVGCVGEKPEDIESPEGLEEDTTLEAWIPEKPADTTLEFWIAEDISSVDFSAHYERFGVFGAREFYGLGYSPAEVIKGSHDVLPEKYVLYTVSGYPDVLDAWNYVTFIKIADPEIQVYGLTCNSSLEEFDKTMEELGYEIHAGSATSHTATLEKVTFRLNSYNGQGTLLISVEVTNKHGIQW